MSLVNKYPVGHICLLHIWKPQTRGSTPHIPPRHLWYPSAGLIEAALPPNLIYRWAKRRQFSFIFFLVLSHKSYACLVDSNMILRSLCPAMRVQCNSFPLSMCWIQWLNSMKEHGRSDGMSLPGISYKRLIYLGTHQLLCSEGVQLSCCDMP